MASLELEFIKNTNHKLRDLKILLKVWANRSALGEDSVETTRQAIRQ